MRETNNQTFHQKLEKEINLFVHKVYDCTSKYPKHEIFGLVSQLRRAAVSVMLNYVEGYARQRKAVLKNFLEISYGSLKESRYIIQFSYERKYLDEAEHKELMGSADQIGKMLWGILSRID